MKKLLITSYVNPDIDGVAGIVAYSEFLQKMGIDNTLGAMGEIHNEAKYVLDRFNFKYPRTILNSNDYDEVILVDTSDLNGIEGNIELGKVVEIIDHRTVHEAEKFPNAKVQIELVGSASTLIAERFIKNNIELSKESAILLLSAIISNTSNFKGGVTTERDREVANYLNNIAQLPDNFWRELFEAKSDLSGDRLLNTIIGDLASYSIGNKRFSIAQIEMIDQLSVDELGVRGQMDLDVDKMYRFHRDVMGATENFDDKELGDINTKKYMKFLLTDGNIYEQRHVLLNLKSKLILKDGIVTVDKTESDELLKDTPPVSQP